MGWGRVCGSPPSWWSQQTWGGGRHRPSSLLTSLGHDLTFYITHTSTSPAPHLWPGLSLLKHWPGGGAEHVIGEVSEMIWVAAWGGQCWGRVPLFTSAEVSRPPPPHHFPSSAGNLDGPLMSTWPSALSSLPCPCMGCPGAGGAAWGWGGRVRCWWPQVHRPCARAHESPARAM